MHNQINPNYLDNFKWFDQNVDQIDLHDYLIRMNLIFLFKKLSNLRINLTIGYSNNFPNINLNLKYLII